MDDIHDIRLLKRDRSVCDHTECRDYQKYEQCHNISHTLCSQYEALYEGRILPQEKRGVMNPISDAERSSF